jgi:hypothetical protein
MADYQDGNPTNADLDEAHAAEIKRRLKEIEGKLRFTKIVASRNIKGRGGDVFTCFSVMSEDFQDPSAEAVSDPEIASQGMTLDEARIAHLIVAQMADIAAHEQALATGSITPDFFRDRVSGIKRNYGKLIAWAMKVRPEANDG